MSAAEARSNRPRPLLLILLAVVALIAAWRYLPSFGGGPGFTRTASADLSSPVIDVVELAAHTQQEAPPEVAATRDPWSFGSRPAPERTAPREAPPVPEPVPVQPVVTERPKPAPPAPTPVGARPPAVDIVYIGTIGRDDDPIAVFTDADKTIYNAPTGGLVKDHFEVQRIGYESVDLLFVGFPDEPAVRLAIGRP